MKKLSIISFFIIMLAGCTKQNVVEEMVPAKPASIQYMGNPAADGLGWVLRFSDQSIEIPTNLMDDFKSEELQVNVAYKKSDKTFPCRCASPKTMVDIISIERINTIAKK